MITKMLDALNTLAPYLNQLAQKPDATITYDVMSDALIWSDEVRPLHAKFAPAQLSCLRPVLRYRTSLILGQPDDRCYELWKFAQEAFPNWPGFTAERVSRTADLNNLYDSYRKSSGIADL